MQIPHESHIHHLLSNALDAVVGMDLNGMISLWNPQAESVFGFSAKEALGKRMSETIIPEQYRSGHEEGMKHYLANGEGPVLNTRIEITALRKDKTEFPIELSITPIHTDGKIEHFYAFIRDISEKQQKEEERTALLSQLEQSLKARDEFITLASHELKTPLTALRLQFQVAEKQIREENPDAFRPDLTQKRVKNANRLMDRMIRLIEDMLDVSRINTGKFQINRERVDLDSLIEEVANQFSDQLKNSQSPLQLNLLPIHVLGDRYRLEQVLLNLFTNAIKYAPGKTITITLTSNNACARMEFRDEGKGISKENLERIFLRFERATPASDASGLGIGLYISKKIVEQHEGKIWAESEPGQNTRFIVEIPIQ